MIRIYAILGLAALGIFSCIVLIGSALEKHRHKRELAEAVQATRSKRNRIWKEAHSVQDMANLYMAMVAKHGPDSDEAQAFRFGADSPLMKHLHGDDEALLAFKQQADLIDETYRLIHKK